MIHLLVLVLCCLAGSAVAQPVQQPTPTTTVAKPAAKPAPNKPAAAVPGGAVAKTTAKTAGPCVGVIPITGGIFSVQKVGIMVFGNAQQDVPIGSWGLDDLIVARVRAALGGRHGTVRRITYPKNAFDRPQRSGIALFRDVEAENAEMLRPIAMPHKCARYVVVAGMSTAFSNTNQSIKGIGIVNYGSSLFSRTYVHAILYVHVYDGTNFAVLKKGTGFVRNFLSMIVRGPHRELDNSAFPEPAAEAARSAPLREATRALIVESLDASLPDLLAH